VARKPSRGFTLLELVIVIGIVSLLVALALDRLFALRVEAERAALDQVLGGLRAAVATEALSLIASGRDAELTRLQGSNPMDYLLEGPASYLGEFDAPKPAEIPPGHWYFDRSRRLLVYRVRYGDHFSSSLGSPERARFRVDVVYDDRNESGTFDPGLDGFGGARLAAEEPYRWLDETVKGIP
jgi:prepilin-type N-terminal cleavage/methylation domain-containing protein